MAELPEDMGRRAAGGTGAAGDEAPAPVDRVFVVMAALVAVDFVLGIGAIVSVPFGRASGWLPVKGRAMYVPHAVIGVLLVLGAVYLLARYGSSAARIPRLAAKTGIAGIVIGVAGGLVAVDHPIRIIGMALMLLGGLVAGIGYAMPSLAAHDEKERARLAAEYPEEANGPIA